MRVATNLIYNRMTKTFQDNYGKLFDSNEMLASGRKVNRPSDDIVAISKSMDYKLEISRNNQYRRNMDDATTFLEYSDSVLSSVLDNLQRVRELAVDGMAGTRNPEDLLAVGREVSVIRDAIFSYSNSSFRGRNIFSGFKTTTSAFINTASDTYTFQGDSGTISVDVNRNAGVVENIPGTDAFVYSLDSVQNVTLDNGAYATYTPGTDTSITVQIFDSTGTMTDNFSYDNFMEMLYQLEDAFNTNNVDKIKALTVSVTDAMDQVVFTRAEIGARLEFIHEENVNNEDISLSVKEVLSRTQDADMSDVISEIAKSETALQALRQSSAQIMQQSLMDFLR